MKISDSIVGAGFVAAGALIVAGTAGYPVLDAGHPGPALFPRIIGALMALFGTLLAAQGLRARDVTQRLDWRRLHRSTGFLNALFVLGGVAGYVALVERVGFLLTGAALLLVLMWRLAVPPLRALLIAVVLNVFIYVVFAKILRVPLPLGIFWL